MHLLRHVTTICVAFALLFFWGLVRVSLTTENTGTFVSWGSSTGCSPQVCGTCQLSDIAGADGALPISLAAQMKMYDTAAVRSLMKRKRITLLGDSLMCETAHDFAILMSGERQRIQHWDIL